MIKGFDLIRGLEIFQHSFPNYRTRIEAEHCSTGIEFRLIAHRNNEIYTSSFILLPDDTQVIAGFCFGRAQLQIQWAMEATNDKLKTS